MAYEIRKGFMLLIKTDGDELEAFYIRGSISVIEGISAGVLGILASI